VSRYEDNIKMNLKEMVLEAVDWIRLAEDVEQWLTVVNTMVNLWVSWTFGFYGRKRFLVQ
jgi:hypothetical protein